MSFIRYQCILHDSGVLFSESWNIYKFKSWDLICEWNIFCRKSELFGALFCMTSLKDLWTKFIAIHEISMHSAWLRSSFLKVLKFLQIKEGDIISRGNQFCRKSELFAPPFFISMLKVLWTKILRHSLDSNAFCMIEENFCQSLEISTN